MRASRATSPSAEGPARRTRGRLARVLGSPWFSWGLLAAPGLCLLQAYGAERLYYGELLHRSGLWAIWLLLATLALSPLKRLLGPARWLRWLGARRRWLGVASFGYAGLHAAVYLERKGDAGRILGEALEPGLATGWLALLIFLALALTSNDAAVRRLGGRGWQRLHRAVHPAAVLTLAHWILTAFDPTTAWIHAAILALLLAPRLLPRRTAGRRPD